MGKTLRVVCLLALLRALFAESLPKLPAPSNVTIKSYNLRQMLTWDPVLPLENSTVTYSVEYNSPIKYVVQYNTISRLSWNTITCEDATKTQCDFTNAVPLSWRIRLQVQATQGQLKSDWVETHEFQATRDTVVGPVSSLNVTPEYGSLFISYSAPFQGTPEDWYLEYELCYWKNKLATKDKACIDTKKIVHTLSNVEAWTEYCVEVIPRYITSRGKRRGKSSDVVCTETEATAFTRAGYIAILLFSLMLIVFGVGLGCFFLLHKFRKDFKHWLYPPFRIPEHIEEYLHDNCPNSYIEKLESQANEEDQYDKLSFVLSEAST
ncbi:interferon gamma receptor 2 isoform X1 [Pleurodeles waltl]|uniref:interferon gamma receptor 2 isoform X1 n=1 Tax=Pleurodeles waltl TaxID=8319 RepID=UPI00370993E3